MDAGEIGAGHTVTAFYEIALADDAGQWHSPSRYQSVAQDTLPDDALAGEIAELRLRYKLPGEASSRLIRQVVLRDSISESMQSMPADYHFAAAVAGFGQLLRGGRYLGDADFAMLEQLARDAIGDDRFGYRAEFVRLVRLADTLYTAAKREMSVRGTDRRDRQG